MESRPQNPEYWIYPEKFHPCKNLTFLSASCLKRSICIPLTTLADKAAVASLFHVSNSSFVDLPETKIYEEYKIQSGVRCLRNRSALAVNCCVLIHCLEVSCKEDQITRVQRE